MLSSQPHAHRLGQLVSAVLFILAVRPIAKSFNMCGVPQLPCELQRSILKTDHAIGRDGIYSRQWRQFCTGLGYKVFENVPLVHIESDARNSDQMRKIAGPGERLFIQGVVQRASAASRAHKEERSCCL